jgi:pyruvate,water dikinase
VSWWRRLFRKDQKTHATKPLALKEQYQRKVRLYSEILTASNAALELMAQMQVRLQGKDYFSPAYIKLNCAIVLDHTRRVVQALQRFTRGQNADLAPIFAKIADQINQASTLALEKEFYPTGLPFEQHTLSTPELLSSGVAYPAKDADLTGALNIKAVWGWWPAVQNGMVRARRYRVAQGRVTEFSSPETDPQEQWLTYRPEQGFALAPIPDKFQGQPCLQEAEALTIAHYYQLLRDNYPNLQEVEWGLGPNREVIFLRSLSSGRPSFQDISGNQVPPELVFSHGITIYPGLASGPAFRIDVDHLSENLDIPEGVVLLANKPALALEPFLAKAVALGVETGEPHNHLAFLARERRLPTIFALGQDTSHMPEGMIISVDASRLQVSAGHRETPPAEAQQGHVNLLVARQMLERLSPWLFSLYTGLPRSPLVPEACQSIHDLLYYASEVRRNEMFCLSLRGEVGKKDGVSLVTGRLVPIVVIDAGGSLTVERPAITFEEVRSVPFRAFLSGMMSIPWPKARPLDVKGFISVIGVTSTTPQAEDQLRKVSFALLSHDYMNFSLCLGYHASTIEAYIGDNLDNNYIRFHYQGGAASIERRLRRLQLIGEILARLGFNVTITGDLLDGLQAGDLAPKLLSKLEILGRLEVYTKQMDMVMSDDAAVSGYVTDFLEKHCQGRQVPQ